MDYQLIFSKYQDLIETRISDRFIKHPLIENILKDLPPEFTVETRGYSEEGRSLNLIIWGAGPQKIFLWSQMHGNEATGTMALFDLINFLQQDTYKKEIERIFKNCTLYILPMVNPDGAERFIRRNAKQIDINRDFLGTKTLEGKLLKNLREEINPDFGFNLHDQDTLWSVEGSLKSATLSYLAPSYDKVLSINETRSKAMQVIIEIFTTLTSFLPGRIGLFSDEFEPRAFGDNFQLAGTSTILVEAGGYKQDIEKQELRKYFFMSILRGIQSIASGSFKTKNIREYLSIPRNDKQIFHLLIHNVEVNGMITSIGLNYEELYLPSSNDQTRKLYTIKDIGNLDYCNAYNVYANDAFKIDRYIEVDSLANFTLSENDEIILSFSGGILS